jgi:hypothetical protein
VSSTTRILLSQRRIINKASVVTHQVNEEHGLQLKDHFIKRIFKEKMGLKYKRVKHIAFQGNNPKNLILRQLFAKKMLEVL